MNIYLQKKKNEEKNHARFSPFFPLFFPHKSCFEVHSHVRDWYKCCIFHTLYMNDSKCIIFLYIVCSMVPPRRIVCQYSLPWLCTLRGRIVTFTSINISSRSTGRQFSFFHLSLSLFSIFTSKGEQLLSEWVYGFWLHFGISNASHLHLLV